MKSTFICIVFALIWLGLLFISSSAWPQNGELYDRLIDEAPRCWQALLKRCGDVETKWTRTTFEFRGIRVPEPLKPKTKHEFKRHNASYVYRWTESIVPDNYDPATVSSMSESELADMISNLKYRWCARGVNGEYAFELRQSNPSSSFAVQSIFLRETERDLYDKTSLMGEESTILLSVANKYLDNVVVDPAFHLQDVSSSGEFVKVVFECDESKTLRPWKRGRVTLDPRNDWLPVEYKIELEVSASDNWTESAVYSYDRKSEDTLDVVVDMKSESNVNRNRISENRREVEVAFLHARPNPEEFQLAGFGIPEPTEKHGKPWALVWAAIGVIVLVAAFVIYSKGLTQKSRD